MILFESLSFKIENSTKTKRRRGQMKKIMIVDDEPKMRNLLKAFLQKEYIVFSAGRGDEAWKILGNPKLIFKPDLLITDVEMPGEINGLQLAKQTKEIFPALPIIVMTGLLSKGIVLPPKNGGADVYLGKPFRLAFLDKMIKKLLGLS
ncbi:MAG: response regulator [Patescibacteria group bacterium]